MAAAQSASAAAIRLERRRGTRRRSGPSSSVDPAVSASAPSACTLAWAGAPRRRTLPLGDGLKFHVFGLDGCRDLQATADIHLAVASARRGLRDLAQPTAKGIARATREGVILPGRAAEVRFRASERIVLIHAELAERIAPGTAHHRQPRLPPSLASERRQRVTDAGQVDGSNTWGSDLRQPGIASDWQIDASKASDPAPGNFR